MATINTADDLIEVLRADSRVRSAVRRELLTDALVALPEKVDKMVESQTAMQQSQTAMQQAQTAMQQAQTVMELTAMLKTQTKMLEDIENLQEGQAAATEHRNTLQRYTARNTTPCIDSGATTPWKLRGETGSRSQRCSRSCTLWSV